MPFSNATMVLTILSTLILLKYFTIYTELKHRTQYKTALKVSRFLPNSLIVNDACLCRLLNYVNVYNRDCFQPHRNIKTVQNIKHFHQVFFSSNVISNYFSHCRLTHNF
jgi:hypothetical protein